jgi:DNA-directed RNA polymerase
VDSKGDQKEVDSPWQFLAFCMEWAQYCIEGDEYVSTLVCALDGTCSGLQHYGMALADEVGGKYVNLIPSDTPSDIYAEVARKVIAQLEIDAVEGTEAFTKEITDEGTGEIKEREVEGTKTMAQQWLKFGVDRSTCKRATMTTAYGSRAYGFKNQLITDILRPALRKATDKDRVVNREVFPFNSDGFSAAGYMAALIWQGVSATVVKAAEAMDWLKNMATLVASEGLPIRWTTPVGFPVFQAYRNMTPRRVETQLAGKRVVLTVSSPEDSIDRRAQSGAVAPNWIHSLDASQLQLTVVRATDKGVESFALVHDSFGTTAGQMPLLYDAVRESMYEQYSTNNVMEVLLAEITTQLTPKNAKKLPPLPERGNLDLSLILDSRYCFA